MGFTVSSGANPARPSARARASSAAADRAGRAGRLLLHQRAIGHAPPWYVSKTDPAGHHPATRPMVPRPDRHACMSLQGIVAVAAVGVCGLTGTLGLVTAAALESPAAPRP